MLYGTSFVAARYAGIRDFLHAAAADADQIPSDGRSAVSKPSPSEQSFTQPLYTTPATCACALRGKLLTHARQTAREGSWCPEAGHSNILSLAAGANGKAGGVAALRTMSSDSDDSAVLVGHPSAPSSAGDGAPVTLSTDQILADE